LPRPTPLPPGTDRPDNPYFAVWRADGTLIKAQNLPAAADNRNHAAMMLSPRPRLTQRDDYREVRMLGPGQTVILVGRSVERLRWVLPALAWRRAAGGAVVFGGGRGGGWWVPARFLRPGAAISATAASISAHDLSRRIPSEAVDRELAE